MGRVLLKAVGVLWVLLFMVPTVTGTVTFKDVNEGDWFEADLNHVLSDSRKMLVGYPDGTYKPSLTLQVDQFIKCVVLAAGHEVTQGEDYWAQNYIDMAIEQGYILEGEFTDYSMGISRSAMAQVVTRVMEVMESPAYSKISEIESNLTDKNSIASKYRESVYKVYELGIITGYPDGTFKPMNTLTRAEATVVLRRIIDASARKPYETVVDVYEEHYKGGSLWVDPITATEEENAIEDKKLIISDKMFYSNRTIDFDDQLGILIDYKETGKPTTEIEDFERILLRRLSPKNVSTIIDYISTKDGWYEFLDEELKIYSFEGYTIEIEDRIQLGWTPYKKSKTIEIDLWK